MRMIDGDALLAEFEKYAECKECGYACDKGAFCDCMRWRSLIKLAPTIDELEKRNEPKMVVMKRPMDYMNMAHCPSCHNFINNVHHNKYCGYCGQAVKWDD